MLNIDVIENPSVDLLERQVRLLTNSPGEILRIENASRGKGLVYHLNRIGEHIVKRDVIEIDCDGGMDYSSPDGMGDLDFIFVQNPDALFVITGALNERRPERERKFWRLNAEHYCGEGRKIILTGYRGE